MYDRDMEKRPPPEGDLPDDPPDEEPPQDLSGMLAGLAADDQMLTAVVNMARMAATFYKQLVEEGINEAAATMITIELIDNLFQRSREADA